jgi:aconitate hydratase
MLGQPVSMLVPQVVGFKLTGKLKEGTTATDLVLTVTEMLRKLGRGGQVCGVLWAGDQRAAAGRSRDDCEYGSGVWSDLRHLPGGCGDAEVSAADGRSEEQIALVEAYYREQGLFHTADAPRLSTRRRCRWIWRRWSRAWRGRSGRRTACCCRRRRRASRSSCRRCWGRTPTRTLCGRWCAGRVRADGSLERRSDQQRRACCRWWRPDGDGERTTRCRCHSVRAGLASVQARFGVDPDPYLDHGSIVIAAITSCTNTSNPYVMVAAGLLAKKAVEKGLSTPPWVKTRWRRVRAW